MRLYIAASALCAGLITLTPVSAATGPAPTASNAVLASATPTPVPSRLLAAAPVAAPPAPPPVPADAPDAAAKHAKRTACLKEAKAKKLLGEDKKAFLKNCLGDA